MRTYEIYFRNLMQRDKFNLPSTGIRNADTPEDALRDYLTNNNLSNDRDRLTVLVRDASTDSIYMFKCERQLRWDVEPSV